MLIYNLPASSERVPTNSWNSDYVAACQWALVSAAMKVSRREELQTGARQDDGGGSPWQVRRVPSQSGSVGGHWRTASRASGARRVRESREGLAPGRRSSQLHAGCWRSSQRSPHRAVVGITSRQRQGRAWDAVHATWRRRPGPCRQSLNSHALHPLQIVPPLRCPANSKPATENAA